VGERIQAPPVEAFQTFTVPFSYPPRIFAHPRRCPERALRLRDTAREWSFSPVVDPDVDCAVAASVRRNLPLGA